jgi:catechol 2,3-dioxygenase-like lactoylglutathione lyase family enzyme
MIDIFISYDYGYHMSAMLQLNAPQPTRCNDPIVRARSLAYLIFERPDLEKTQRFLADFGLATAELTNDALYMRAAADNAPYCYVVRRARRARFVGFGLTVQSRGALERCARLPEACGIEALDGPGAGEVVRLTDPSGFQVDVVHGRAATAELAHRGPLAFNVPTQPARINAAQRVEVRPPQVLKLGHIVLEVSDFQRTCAWYGATLGLIPSDVQVLADGAPAVAFMRLDLGATPTDHHTLAIAQAFKPAYSHSAFEVIDADAVGMGHRVLREGGWRHEWGIGRHVLGSQIFDYWSDPWGAKHEHYCDGDVCTSEQPTGVHALSRAAMAQWGTPMPARFTRPPLTFAGVAGLLRSLRRSPDVTLRKLRALARALT